jgi:hypothetical protein
MASRVKDTAETDTPPYLKQSTQKLTNCFPEMLSKVKIESKNHVIGPEFPLKVKIS